MACGAPHITRWRGMPGILDTLVSVTEKLAFYYSREITKNILLIVVKGDCLCLVKKGRSGIP